MTRSGCAALLLCMLAAPIAAQKAAPHGPWTAPRTPWGDPDLQGVYTNEREVGVPMERPERFAGRAAESITPQELAAFGRALNEGRQRRSDQAFGGLSPQRFDLMPTRAWHLVDPRDGRMPPLTPLGAQRQQAYAARLQRPLASAADSNLWYRCISIGVPRSMMPLADRGNVRIVQAPGHVAIQLEMMHETRVIPLDRRPRVNDAIRMYMGDARGYWEGTTLVVETRNFNGEFQTTSAAGTDLRVVERFTPQPSGSLEWTVTVDDASGWTRPWTFAIPLERAADDQGPLESACHEGNYPLRNMLRAQRAEERQAAAPPDLEGVWSFATLTPLERPAELMGRAFFTTEEATAFERATRALRPPALNALNEFWFDERGPMASLDGRWPTSLIVDPAEGRLPALTADAEERRAQRARARGALVDVHAFSLSERCLRSAAGPPYIPGPADANLIRITQSGDQVAISQERFGETRIIAVDGRPPLPSAIRSWMGDSRGRWEGETLVVRTTNFAEGLDGSNRFDRNLRLVERFTRVGPDTLRYEFTVDDPTVFSAPWTVVLPMRRITGQMYEVACHEGNYSLANMLTAARAENAAQSAPSPVAADGFDPAVARAWTGAGAQIGWLAPDTRPQYAINENWVFTEAKPSSSTGLPAFRFGALTSGVLRSLPEPRVPFAIVLDGAAIADDALDGAGRFMNLHALYLSRTRVTDAALGPDQLPSNLRVLYLGQTNVTDAGVKQLARLLELHHLRLSVTAVTDAGLRDVARLRKLQWLNLESTQIGDAGVKELLRLPALRILHLGTTQVTDAGVLELAKLASLRIVRLPGASVSANGAAALRRVRPDMAVFPPSNASTSAPIR